MLAIKKELEKALTKATQLAFPVKDQAKVKPKSALADYECSIPSQVFNNYKKEQVTFGLFTSREIADAIFVNVEKQKYLQRVEISVTGDLDLYLKDSYLLEEINSILHKRRIEVAETAPPSHIVTVGPEFGQKPNLFHLRQLLLCRSLFSCFEVLNAKVPYTMLCYDVSKPLFEFFSQGNHDPYELIGNALQSPTFFQEVKFQISTELAKLNSLTKAEFRKEFTSDLLNQTIEHQFSENRSEVTMKKFLGSNYKELELLGKKWPWDWFHIIKTFNSSSTSKVIQFCKYYEDSNLHKLQKALKSFDPGLVSRTQFVKVGDILSSEGKLTNWPIEQILDSLENIGHYRTAMCYEPSYSSKAALFYYILRRLQVSTFHINIDEVFAKSSTSLFGPLAAFNYCNSNLSQLSLENIQEFKPQDFENPFVRSFAKETCMFADKVVLCAEDCSLHHLAEWFENLCKLYMRLERNLNPEVKPKVELLLKILTEQTLDIFGVDTEKLYRSNK